MTTSLLRSPERFIIYNYCCCNNTAIYLNYYPNFGCYCYDISTILLSSIPNVIFNDVFGIKKYPERITSTSTIKDTGFTKAVTILISLDRDRIYKMKQKLSIHRTIQYRIPFKLESFVHSYCIYRPVHTKFIYNTIFIFGETVLYYTWDCLCGYKPRLNWSARRLYSFLLVKMHLHHCNNNRK